MVSLLFLFRETPLTHLFHRLEEVRPTIESFSFRLKREPDTEPVYWQVAGDFDSFEPMCAAIEKRFFANEVERLRPPFPVNIVVDESHHRNGELEDVGVPRKLFRCILL